MSDEEVQPVYIENPNPPPEGTKVTSRGFAIYDEFVDQYGSKIRVVQSSLATEECVWIFVENSDMLAPDAHLNREQAKRVILALAEFVGETR